jgi:hypothetical protein
MSDIDMCRLMGQIEEAKSDLRWAEEMAESKKKEIKRLEGNLALLEERNRMHQTVGVSDVTIRLADVQAEHTKETRKAEKHGFESRKANEIPIPSRCQKQDGRILSPIDSETWINQGW